MITIFQQMADEVKELSKTVVNAGADALNMKSPFPERNNPSTSTTSSTSTVTAQIKNKRVMLLNNYIQPKEKSKNPFQSWRYSNTTNIVGFEEVAKHDLGKTNGNQLLVIELMEDILPTDFDMRTSDFNASMFNDPER